MKARYLFPKDYMADPSANVFNGRLYVYPSHDWDSGESFDDDGGHFQMKDYHVLSMDDVMEGEVTDHGVILDVKDVPWAEKQMWDNDVVEKDGKYYQNARSEERFSRNAETVGVGTMVTRSGKRAGIPVGDAFLGRVISPLGEP